MHGYQGLEGLSRVFAPDAVTSLVAVHHGHIGEIEITGEARARGIWAMEDVIHNAPGEEHFHMHGMGYYHDTYVKLAIG